MQATRSSKYSMTPLNVSEVRKGRPDLASRGGRRLVLSGQDRGGEKQRLRSRRLVNVERVMSTGIASGEKYPE